MKDTLIKVDSYMASLKFLKGFCDLTVIDSLLN